MCDFFVDGYNDKAFTLTIQFGLAPEFILDFKNDRVAIYG